MKIIYLWAFENKQDHAAIEQEVSSWGYDIKMVDFQHYLNTCKISWQELDRLYKTGDAKLMRLYNYLYRTSRNYDILIVNYSNPLHPNFLNSLKGRIYTVLHSGDDPQGSSNCSEQYVKYFDHAFCFGEVYDKNTSITEQFKKWGAKRADRWVYGVRKDMYDSDLTIDDIRNNKRDIDVVIVTQPWKKEDELSYIKTKIPNARIHGHDYFGVMGGHILRSLIKGKLPNLGMIKLVFATEVPHNDLANLYQRSKIGINIHLGKIDDIHEFGCSGGNLRTTQLPANGVLQISGCANGVKDLFEINKEIVCFDNIEDAVRKAKYYLNHDDERKEIAVNGFIKTVSNYKCKTTFESALQKMIAGMREEGISHYKDGELIL